jgi:hypothetical protein
MIHGNLPPAVVHGRPWWEDRRLRALARGDHTDADERRSA